MHDGGLLLPRPAPYLVDDEGVAVEVVLVAVQLALARRADLQGWGGA